jgi:predicted nucleic acid-binding protein
VLTRLPSDARFAPLDAAEVITRRFVDVVTLPDADASTIHARFAEVGIVGGAVYDGLVALTAIVRGLPLATRDQRARPTYAALGIQPIVLAAA